MSTTRISDLPIVLVVSFDGFRHSYLTPTQTPVLSKLALSGATCPYMIPVFPSKTFPNHQSICTGLYPSAHGIVDKNFYDTKYGSKIDGKRNTFGFWNYDPQVLPLWIRNEQQGGISGCMMWPGSDHGYGPDSSLFPTYFFPSYNKSISWESRVDTVINWLTDSTKPANLVFLYLHEPDLTGHRYGPYAKETLTQVEETDKRANLLINKLKEANIYEKVNLIILSDHGLEEVTIDRVIDLNNAIDKSELVSVVYGGSPVIQVVPKIGKEYQLYAQLMAAAESGKGKKLKVLRKSELCNAPYFLCENRRVHEFVLLAEPGWGFKRLSDKQRPRRQGEIKPWGSHGYLHTAECMRTFLIARGPAFKSGYITSKPIKNVDVVPLISKVIGIKNVPANGELARVQEMLKKRNILAQNSWNLYYVSAFLAIVYILTVWCFNI